MYVELAVETPKNLNSKQRALLKEFAEAGGDNISPESQGFLDKAKNFWDNLVD